MVDLSFCGCQDSNLEQYIDRMCHIIIKKCLLWHILSQMGLPICSQRLQFLA